MRLLAGAIVAGLVLGACGGPSLSTLTERLCVDLDESHIRDIDGYVNDNSYYENADKVELVAAARDRCPDAVARAEERSKAPPPTPAPPTDGSVDEGDPVERADWMEGYTVGYWSCSNDPGGAYEEAGTRDKRKAADWAATTFTADTDQGYVEGCLDALSGEPERFSE